MTQSFNSGSVTANIIKSSATQKTISFLGGTPINATTTLGTVGAGKRWVIVGLGGTFVGIDLSASIQLNGVSAMSFYCYVDDATIACRDQTYSYDLAPVITAGQTVAVNFPGSGKGIFNVSYIEETV